jgi:preprotein translocase subunit SecD
MLRALAIVAFLLSAAVALAEPVPLGVKSANLAFDPTTGEPVLAIALTATSARDFAKLTANNVGRILDLSIDDAVVASPVIREPILTGYVQVTGDFDAPTLRDIADRLVAGTAKVTVELRSQ